MSAGTTSELSPGAAPLSLGEAKAWIGIAGDGDDAAIAGLVRGAGATCEAFIRQWLIERDGVCVLEAVAGWQRIGAMPVRVISGIAAIDLDGVETALLSEDFDRRIDADGEGWVRLRRPVGSARIAVRFRAGIAADPGALPETIRQGLLRLVAHGHANRGAGEEAQPPSAVAALWRPFRRLSL